MHNIDILTKNVEQLLLDILKVDSLTGHEAVLADYLCNILSQDGFEIIEIEHGVDRKSLVAKYGTPKIAFCSHLDTALPYNMPKRESNIIYGIGAGDTKASVATQIIFAQELRKQNKDIMLLLLAGEESDSVGAHSVIDKNLLNVDYMIHGEPTNGYIGEATAGVIEIELVAEGMIGHSSILGFEQSSIYSLFINLNLMNQICKKKDWRFHIGSVHAGSAPGDFPKRSAAMVQIRSFCNIQKVLDVLNMIVGNKAKMNIIYASEPCFFHCVDGMKTKRFWFGSDASLFSGHCMQILLGPGNIERAHSVDEFISVDEIKVGIKNMIYVYQTLSNS